MISRHAWFRSRASRIACIALACGASLAATPSPLDTRAAEASDSASTPTRAAAVDSLTATVRSVDPAAGTLEVVTGVGYALRVVRFEVPQWRTEPAVHRVPLAGDVVHVRYMPGAAAGGIAISVETRPPE